MESFFCLTSHRQKALLEALQAYLVRCRWFSSKSKTIKQVDVEEEFSLNPTNEFSLLFFWVIYTDGQRELYSLPLEKIKSSQRSQEEELFFDPEHSIRYLEATTKTKWCRLFFDLIAKETELYGRKAKLKGYGSSFLRSWNAPDDVKVQFLSLEQSNSSCVLNNQFFLKLYRKLEPGENPEVEILSFLTEKSSFAHVPACMGKIELFIEATNYTVGLLTTYVHNQGSGWKRALGALSRCIEQARSIPSAEVDRWLDEKLQSDYFGPDASLLGQRTAELHLGLADAQGIASFEPQPLEKRDLSFLFDETLQLMDERWADATTNPWFNVLLSKKNLSFSSLKDRVRQRLEEKIAEVEEGCLYKIRTHGDYHLGQVLWTGSDYLIIDFEGEPNRTMEERKIRWPALRDVAGMMRSFHYVAYCCLKAKEREDPFEKELAIQWYLKISKNFLETYKQKAWGTLLLPTTERYLQPLLGFFLLEKLIYEVGYELGSRPSWVEIPLSALLELIS